MIWKAVKFLTAIFAVSIAVGYLYSQTQIDSGSKVIKIKEKYVQYKNKRILNRFDVREKERFVVTAKGKIYKVQGSLFRLDFFSDGRYGLFKPDHCYIIETEGHITEKEPYKNIVDAGEYSCS